MTKMTEFIKTTFLGGILVILPIALIALLLIMAIAYVLKLLAPIIFLLPEKVILPEVMALLIVVGACFLTGLILKTRIGQKLHQAGESHILERIPGYTLVRNLSRQLAGRDEAASFAPALVEIEAALVPAFLVEEHEDGSFTVFVPSSPTPTIGALYILPGERVHPIDVPFVKAIECISRWGIGSDALLRAMRRPSTSP